VNRPRSVASERQEHSRNQHEAYKRIERVLDGPDHELIVGDGCYGIAFWRGFLIEINVSSR